jgi:hypothetical protein
MNTDELKEILNKIDALCDKLGIPNSFNIIDIQIFDNRVMINCELFDNSGKIITNIIPLVYNEKCGVKVADIIVDKNEAIIKMVIQK